MSSAEVSIYDNRSRYPKEKLKPTNKNTVSTNFFFRTGRVVNIPIFYSALSKITIVTRNILLPTPSYGGTNRFALCADLMV